MITKKSLEHYIGIDESNHGRYPEIFVAINSIHEEDIKYHKELPKRRYKYKKRRDLERTYRTFWTTCNKNSSNEQFDIFFQK